MVCDQVVTSRDVLQALMQIRRAGSKTATENLEKQEPDLTEFLLEELSAIHHQILQLAIKPSLERRLVRRIETMSLVLVTSLRNARLRLWKEDDSDGRLAKIDPPLGSQPFSLGEDHPHLSP